MRAGKTIIRVLCIACLIWLQGCGRYAEPKLEINDSWPTEFEYDVEKHNLVSGCINIAGTYEPIAKKYRLEDGSLLLVKEDMMVLSSFFDVSKPVQKEIEIKVSEPKATIKPYYIVQSEEDMEVAFYRFDGSIRYISSLYKRKHYYCDGERIILPQRYYKYGAEGTSINYKRYIEIKKIKDGLLIYENIANAKGNHHYYYQYKLIKAKI